MLSSWMLLKTRSVSAFALIMLPLLVAKSSTYFESLTTYDLFIEQLLFSFAYEPIARIRDLCF